MVQLIWAEVMGSATNCKHQGWISDGLMVWCRDCKQWIHKLKEEQNEKQKQVHTTPR